MGTGFLSPPPLYDSFFFLSLYLSLPLYKRCTHSIPPAFPPLNYASKDDEDRRFFSIFFFLSFWIVFILSSFFLVLDLDLTR